MAPVIRNRITQGIIDQAANFSDFQATCSRSNCTFPLYNTLGVCASVQDYSSHLIKKCVPSDPSVCYQSIDELIDHPPARALFGLGGSVDIAMSSYENEQAWQERLDGFISNQASILSEFYLLYPTPSLEPTERGSNNSIDSLAAQKIVLSLCVYALQTSVRNGQTDTTVSTVHEDLDWQWDGPEFFSPVTATLDKVQYLITAEMRPALNTYLATEVIKVSWSGITSYVEDDGDIAKAFGHALYRNESGKLVFQGLEQVNKILESLTVAITNG